MNKVLEMIISTGLATLVAIIISSLLLPEFLVVLTPILNSMEITVVSSLITYFGLLVLIGASIVMSFVFARQYKFGLMMELMIMSSILTLIVIMGISYLILIGWYPEVLQDQTIIARVLGWYQAPGIITLKLGSPQPGWILSEIVYLVFFNSAFAYLVEKGKGGVKA